MRTSTALLVLLVVPFVLLPGCGGDEDAKAPPAVSPYAATPEGTPSGGAPAAGLDATLRADVEAALAAGRDLLLSVQQPDGSWGDPTGQIPPSVGYTAMAATAVIGATPASRVAGDAAIGRALDWLAAQQKEDGSIFDNPAFVTYSTSAAIGALASAKIPAYRDVQVKARDYLAASQIASDEADPSYGGFPYKQAQGQPSDLSNFQFAVQALADAGLPADHPVWRRSLAYLARVQNRSEGNPAAVERDVDGRQVTVVSGDDGGAIYLPGDSKAGWIERSDGRLEARSYGSMTYALLKGLLLAGVDAADPRVVAALGWISRHFTVDRNPGFEAAQDPAKAGQQGWFYFVFTMARTLAEYERLTRAPLVVKDAAGTTRDWRSELARAILDRRQPDGWWVNEVSERWDEGSQVLATSYALQALAELSGRFR